MDTETENKATLAVAHLYHSWITGLVLSLINHKGIDVAAEFVFRLFRRQHLDRFIPGLQKLGLDELPHALAAAQYHYFSNQLGGVKVEYFRENDRKAWIRYPPPRWIWAGSAICAIPADVNSAMLRGWHAHNGVSLGNPRLGFVCTKTTVAGDPGLEGYYLEYDRDLEPAERLRFAPDESCPPIDRNTLPRLDVDTWPAARQAKAYRNYAMEYVRNGLPLLIELVGPLEGRRLGRLCGRQIGMQSYDDVCLGLSPDGSAGDEFMPMFETLLRASGDRVVVNDGTLERTFWRLFPDVDVDRNVLEIWCAPFQGLLAAHDRFLILECHDDYRFALGPCPRATRRAE